VGISYDSDDELAVELINQIINEAPLVLKDPEPSVYFLSFGDSSLDFSVRVFVRELKDRWAVSDYIHKKIRRAFKHNNIEIPYPQRDLHIRSSDLTGNQ
jgi:potassium efflux system protein